MILDTVGTDLPAFHRLLTQRGRLVEIAFNPDRLLATVGYALLHSRRRTGRSGSSAAIPTAR
ncbi:hypothetical protein [Amycolatopsis panacis]|uniref:hypothetical protein n=1 Tax=Amycolatopsis panacis TaxID=2340917 RepID=UPI001F1BE5A1|nr:hypothetical protein [Amycolatopsis panacis]